MTVTPSNELTQGPLRLWPGVLAVVLQWLAWRVAPLALPGATGGYVAALGLPVGGLAIAAWWVFFSRAPRVDRWGAAGLTIVALVVTPRFLDESVAQGNLGFQFFLYVIPVLSLAFVTWAVLTRSVPDRPRRVAMVLTILLACGTWTLVRSDGITGDGAAQFAWRWAETPEERLLARASDEPATLQPLPEAAPTGADWPGFGGPQRDGVIAGVRIETDWSRKPPVELWRRAVGPGASSFAVGGDLLYTQEQRGRDELVASYRVSTGEPVWRHHDAIRFWDAHVGAGPRATPALSDGRVYALGATGILNALDAADGSVLWSRDVASDTDADVPQFGFTGSPLVTRDVVIVQTNTLVAYDLATGEPRWFGPVRSPSYSSPQLLTLDGVPQLLMLSGGGATAIRPVDGALLWEHSWEGSGIVQPNSTADGDVLIGMVSSLAAPMGMLRIAVTHEGGGWTTEERWTSRGLKPSFSQFVVHRGHAFGFDGRILACIDLENGERTWKGGRYGSGQLVLLPEQDLLLVLSERGELALVRAIPEGFTELARLPAIEGKTWSEPALVGNVLLVRNGREMAAFRLQSSPL